MYGTSGSSRTMWTTRSIVDGGAGVASPRTTPAEHSVVGHDR
ncbi:hypothetical protein [Streptomyces sp. NL15-2K]|nr:MULTISPECIES: hypothetical protein [Actinomycetes]WKX15318.1 hypothetical protein Q4V64_50625 [Kutzneria buriramensis]GCB52446.1 hypothetical protein SNL152K_9802 [Streptomyces sp. NL15-2K]